MRDPCQHTAPGVRLTRSHVSGELKDVSNLVSETTRGERERERERLPTRLLSLSLSPLRACLCSYVSLSPCVSSPAASFSSWLQFLAEDRLCFN